MDGVAHFVVEHDIADLLSQFLGSGLHLPQLLAIELKGNPSDLRFEGGKSVLDRKTGISTNFANLSSGKGTNHGMLKGSTD